MSDTRKMIIIWSWPAGHTAAIYAGRAMLEPLMFEWRMAWWVAAWWQLTTTTEVENYPWFPTWITGPELMMNMREQSLNSGCEIITKTVDRVEFSQDPRVTPHKVFVWKDTYTAETIVIATGATAKRLWLPWEEKYWQRGISACAVCDGALPIFRDKELIVIGWWDSACEEANFLTKFASKVTMLVRRDVLRASKVMQQRVFDNPKIEILWNTEWVEIVWDGDVMTGMNIINNSTQETSELTAWWLFYAIWHKPNTGFLENQLALDDAWYLLVKAWTAQTFSFGTETAMPWVYAWWDVQDKKYRQAITSAGTWCMAALEAEHFLQ